MSARYAPLKELGNSFDIQNTHVTHIAYSRCKSTEFYQPKRKMLGNGYAGIPVPPLIDVSGVASGLAGNALKTVGL